MWIYYSALKMCSLECKNFEYILEKRINKYNKKKVIIKESLKSIHVNRNVKVKYTMLTINCLSNLSTQVY